MQNIEQTSDKIIDLAQKLDNVRAALLHGSRANVNIEPDIFQDFDVTFFVNNIEHLLNDRTWLQALGTPIVQQLPDDMYLGNDNKVKKASFTFLMQYKNGIRIDLTLFPLDKMQTHYHTKSLSVVLCDKDGLFKQLPMASDEDYWTMRPSELEFSEVCNEFWWCIANVAKGLARHQIIYAKNMIETVVRPMLIQLLTWQAAYGHLFKINLGASGKFLADYLEEDTYLQFLNTYSNAEWSNNWEAMIRTCELFKEQQILLGRRLNFSINFSEIEGALKYILWVQNHLK